MSRDEKQDTGHTMGLCEPFTSQRHESTHQEWWTEKAVPVSQRRKEVSLVILFREELTFEVSYLLYSVIQGIIGTSEAQLSTGSSPQQSRITMKIQSLFNPIFCFSKGNLWVKEDFIGRIRKNTRRVNSYSWETHKVRVSSYVFCKFLHKGVLRANKHCCISKIWLNSESQKQENAQIPQLMHFCAYSNSINVMFITQKKMVFFFFF